MLLAIESATPALSVVIWRGAELLAEGSEPNTRQHAEALLPRIDEALEHAGLALHEIDAFAVSIGPGTFTSLRIGLATVKGLAFGSDRPVAAVSTLAALAHAGGPAVVGPRIAVLDAKRGEVYAGAFDAADSFAVCADLLPEAVYSVEELAARLPDAFELVGEGVAGLAEALHQAGRRGASPSSREVLPSARSVAAVGADILGKGSGVPAESLLPRYLRRAQAEEDRVRSLERG